MQRDMDLIRAILLEVEALPVNQPWNAEPMLGHERKEVVEHVRLAQESGLVEANFMTGPHAVIWRLTSSGHDFVEAARPQPFWQRSKDRVRELGLPLTISSVQSVVAVLIKEGIARLH